MEVKFTKTQFQRTGGNSESYDAAAAKKKTPLSEEALERIDDEKDLLGRDFEENAAPKPASPSSPGNL